MDVTTPYCKQDPTPELLDRLRAVAPSESQASSALRTYCLVKLWGWDRTLGIMPAGSFYRHIRMLKTAGVSRWLVMNDGEAVEKISAATNNPEAAERIYLDILAGNEGRHTKILRRAIYDRSVSPVANHSRHGSLTGCY